MILLNVGLENSPGWDLVPASVKEAYLSTPPRGGKKIILDEDDFLNITSEEVRNVFLLCHTTAYFEWSSLDILLHSKWRLYPHAYVTYAGRVSPQEMFEKLETEGVFPIGFVDHNGEVNYF